MPFMKVDAVASEVSSGPKIVYVVDDHSEMRRSLHFLLSTLQIRAWPFVSGSDFLEQQPHLSPAPILLDMRMSGMDGFEVLTELDRRAVDWPVVLMTGHGDVVTAVRAMKLGAIEFLEKPFEAEALEIALTNAFQIEERNQGARLRKADARRRLDQLTPRETEVIGCLVQGQPNKLVAHRLGLSPRTIEMHRANAFQKLGARSIAEVVTLAASLDDR